jgi:hypothetical protein
MTDMTTNDNGMGAPWAETFERYAIIITDLLEIDVVEITAFGPEHVDV